MRLLGIIGISIAAFIIIFVLLWHILRLFISFPKMKQELADNLYDIIKKTHQILTDNGIEYILTDGTLLGSVRDGGLIAWDGDLDIVIIDKDLPQLIMLENVFAKNGLKLYEYRDGFWRVEYSDKKKGHLDIFIFGLIDDRYTHINPIHRVIWSGYYFKDELFPIKQNCKMGQLKLCGPNKPKKFLRRRYGDWERPCTLWPFFMTSNLSLFHKILYPYPDKEQRIILPSV